MKGYDKEQSLFRSFSVTPQSLSVAKRGDDMAVRVGAWRDLIGSCGFSFISAHRRVTGTRSSRDDIAMIQAASWSSDVLQVDYDVLLVSSIGDGYLSFFLCRPPPSRTTVPIYPHPADSKLLRRALLPLHGSAPYLCHPLDASRRTAWLATSPIPPLFGETYPTTRLNKTSNFSVFECHAT